MSLPAFPHNFGFDPRYGYDLDALLKLDAPAAPAGFAAFWQDLYSQTLAIQPLPVSREISSPVADLRLFEIEFNSLNFYRIRGWLTLPRQGPVTRGVVVGHGYGGRDGPDLSLPMTQAAAIFPCARGLSRSAHPVVPGDPSRHVLYGIHSRHSYVLGGSAADIVWCAASALRALVPDTAPRLDYLGISFGGGIGALALPWDARFTSGHLNVPTFGNHPLRLTLPCIGSGEAVRHYHRQGGEVLDVLRYFDAASAARYLRIPMHLALALFDPAVPPPGQFAIYNAIPGRKHRFTLQAGHYEHPGKADEDRRLLASLTAFFQ
jgi:cephalosporin-C deacetylase